MATDTVTALARARRGVVIAAAGCGKTEAIAAAVSGGEGRQLVLTHTHAGVKVLGQRLAKFKVPRKRCHVDTIAGWALNYAVHYPKLSGLEEKEPTGQAWAQVYDAATCALDSAAVRRVITESYAGIYVDEYQDCTVGQHRLILKLADIIPCRILGDPLQGIFGFGAEQLVDWASDVETNFERLPDLTFPWRWEARNAALGRRLMDIRTALLAGDEIDLRVPPIVWRPSTPEEQWKACLEIVRQQGSAVAIHKWPQHCHALASKLKGSFTSMEEMDCRDLLKWAERLDGAKGPLRALQVIQFASECMTVVGTELAAVAAKLKGGALPDPKRIRQHREVVQALVGVVQSSSPDPVLRALRAIEKMPRRVLYRRELLREMERALEFQMRNPSGSLRDAAWKSRNRARHAGRIVEYRTISRTLLVKGLEFDHAVVLNATDHDARNLYVAMTRASKSLTVLSASPRLKLERAI